MTAKEFNDAKTYGPCAELHLFFTTRDQEQPAFSFSLHSVVDVCLSGGNDPLSQGALKVLPWSRASGPIGPGAGTRDFFVRAGRARTGTFFPHDIRALVFRTSC